MTLSDTNPGFKVTGYLQVEYLADRALPKTCKKFWGRRWNFSAKSAGRCFTPVTKIKPTPSVFIETSTQTYSLSEEGFGYNYGRLKSSSSHACR